jgi:hypothetical protein
MKGNRSSDETLEDHHDKRPKRAATSVQHVTLETQKKTGRLRRLAVRDEVCQRDRITHRPVNVALLILSRSSRRRADGHDAEGARRRSLSLQFAAGHALGRRLLWTAFQTQERHHARSEGGQMRSADRVRKCLLFGVDRTYRRHHETDAFDPTRTCRPGLLDNLVGAGEEAHLLSAKRRHPSSLTRSPRRRPSAAAGPRCRAPSPS